MAKTTTISKRNEKTNPNKNTRRALNSLRNLRSTFVSRVVHDKGVRIQEKNSKKKVPNGVFMFMLIFFCQFSVYESNSMCGKYVDSIKSFGLPPQTIRLCVDMSYQIDCRNFLFRWTNTKDFFFFRRCQHFKCSQNKTFQKSSHDISSFLD